MPQISPLSWISILLLLFTFVLITNSLINSGNLPHTLESEAQLTNTQLNWNW